MKKSKIEKEEKKQYEKYAAQFTPGTKFVSNGIKAFTVGGAICLAAAFVKLWLQNYFGISEKEAGTAVTVGLIVTAQLMTGLGWFAPAAKFAGAGVIVPITGFANSMVAPAMEYKTEGPVLGAGSALFKLAGPVLVCGLSMSVVFGLICILLGFFGIGYSI